MTFAIKLAQLTDSKKKILKNRSAEVDLSGGGGGGERGGRTIYMPISTEGSGMPTTRPETGCPV